MKGRPWGRSGCLPGHGATARATLRREAPARGRVRHASHLGVKGRRRTVTAAAHFKHAQTKAKHAGEHRGRSEAALATIPLRRRVTIKRLPQCIKSMGCLVPKSPRGQVKQLAIRLLPPLGVDDGEQPPCRRRKAAAANGARTRPRRREAARALAAGPRRALVRVTRHGLRDKHPHSKPRALRAVLIMSGRNRERGSVTGNWGKGTQSGSVGRTVDRMGSGRGRPGRPGPMGGAGWARAVLWSRQPWRPGRRPWQHCQGGSEEWRQGPGNRFSS